MKHFCAILCAVAAVWSAAAQNTESKDYIYRQEVRPVGLDNCSFSSYYYNGTRIYNIRSYQVCEAPGEVKAMAVNPSGASAAVFSLRKGKKAELNIYSLFKANRLIRNLKVGYVPSALAFAPNARTFAVASTDRKLHLYDARNWTETKTYDFAIDARMLAISSNNYFFAVSDGRALEIYNYETGYLRKAVPVENAINYIAFSHDNTTLAVLTADGTMTLYDTRTFLPVQSFGDLGTARSCDFHMDGKYVAVASANDRITLINKYEPDDRHSFACAGTGVGEVRFVNDMNNRTFVLYNTTEAIVYTLQTDLKPNFNLLLGDEVNDRMNAWLKQMPGETLEEYQARVNDETRMRQRELFETEIATRMADNLLAASTVTLGNFNLSTNTLALNFDTMPTIYLEVPKAEAAQFLSPDDLEFYNALYGLMPDDHFELVYVDVFNRTTQATYTFDKRARRSLDFASMDDEIVPLEIVQRSNMEEMRLREIRESVLEEAKTQNIVSDHTHISVKTSVEPSVDADGEKILNYLVGFSYNVEEGFSAQEDFGPGKYQTSGSGAASSMVAIISKAFESEFAQYVKPGKKVRVAVTGMADNLKIHGRIPYDGVYGDFVDEPIRNGGEIMAITVTKASGITQNEQLAFMRAVGVKESIAAGVPALADMDTDYEYLIQLLDKAGGEYRRISVDFTFIDAF